MSSSSSSSAYLPSIFVDPIDMDQFSEKPDYHTAGIPALPNPEFAPDTMTGAFQTCLKIKAPFRKYPDSLDARVFLSSPPLLSDFHRIALLTLHFHPSLYWVNHPHTEKLFRFPLDTNKIYNALGSVAEPLFQSLQGKDDGLLVRLFHEARWTFDPPWHKKEYKITLRQTLRLCDVRALLGVYANKYCDDEELVHILVAHRVALFQQWGLVGALRTTRPNRLAFLVRTASRDIPEEDPRAFERTFVDSEMVYLTLSDEQIPQDLPQLGFVGGEIFVHKQTEREQTVVSPSLPVDQRFENGIYVVVEQVGQRSSAEHSLDPRVMGHPNRTGTLVNYAIVNDRSRVSGRTPRTKDGHRVPFIRSLATIQVGEFTLGDFPTRFLGRASVYAPDKPSPVPLISGIQSVRAHYRLVTHTFAVVNTRIVFLPLQDQEYGLEFLKTRWSVLDQDARQLVVNTLRRARTSIRELFIPVSQRSALLPLAGDCNPRAQDVNNSTDFREMRLALQGSLRHETQLETSAHAGWGGYVFVEMSSIVERLRPVIPAVIWKCLVTTQGEEDDWSTNRIARILRGPYQKLHIGHGDDLWKGETSSSSSVSTNKRKPVAPVPQPSVTKKPKTQSVTEESSSASSSSSSETNRGRTTLRTTHIVGPSIPERTHTEEEEEEEEEDADGDVVLLSSESTILSSLPPSPISSSEISDLSDDSD